MNKQKNQQSFEIFSAFVRIKGKQSLLDPPRNMALTTQKSKFGVSLKKEQALRKKMRKFRIYEKDIEEKFVRSSGKGGQRTNKASTCVYLKHLPTQIEVKCQKERWQALNRYHARKILTQKIESMILGKKSEEQRRIEKIRRQKRKRSKRAKEKMLDEKKKHSQKKKERSYKPSSEEIEGEK